MIGRVPLANSDKQTSSICYDIMVALIRAFEMIFKHQSECDQDPVDSGDLQCYLLTVGKGQPSEYFKGSFQSHRAIKTDWRGLLIWKA